MVFPSLATILLDCTPTRFFQEIVDATPVGPPAHKVHPRFNAKDVSDLRPRKTTCQKQQHFPSWSLWFIGDGRNTQVTAPTKPWEVVVKTNPRTQKFSFSADNRKTLNCGNFFLFFCISTLSTTLPLCTCRKAVCVAKKFKWKKFLWKLCQKAFNCISPRSVQTGTSVHSYLKSPICVCQAFNRQEHMCISVPILPFSHLISKCFTN